MGQPGRPREPALDLDVPPLRWWVGQPWQGGEIGSQVVVTADETVWQGSSEDRRARWLHLSSIGVTALAIPVFLPAPLENQDGDRPFLPPALLGGLLLVGLGIVLRLAGVRLRRRIGYRIPPSMREIVEVTHAAEAIVREVFSQKFKARQAHRQLRNRLFYYLEELDRARLRGRTKRWCKCYRKIMALVGEILDAAAVLTGASDAHNRPEADDA